MSKTVLVIGNSHTTAIVSALAKVPRPGVEAINILMHKREQGKAAKLIAPAMLDADRRSAIICSFGGSEHTVLGLLEAPQPFDFMTPETSDIDPGRAAIPYAMIEALLGSLLNTARANWRTTRAAFAGPIHQIASPPPFRDPPAGIEWPAAFIDQLDRGFTPPAVRLKLYRAHCAVVRAACAEFDIGYLEYPPQATDADGYLRDKYWTREPTHANGAYGNLVLDQIAATLGIDARKEAA